MKTATIIFISLVLIIGIYAGSKVGFNANCIDTINADCK